MKADRSIIFSIVAGFILSAVVIAGLALVLNPVESRSELFWPRTFWTIILSGVIWTGCGSYFTLPARRAAANREEGGIAPSVILVALVYSVLSFLAMMFHAYMPHGELSSRLHLFLQIVLAGVSAAVLVFMNLARSHAGAGIQTAFGNIPSPALLSSQLAADESWLRSHSSHVNWDRCADLVKQLRETIAYSLNQTDILVNNPDYQGLVSDIQVLRQSLRSCTDPSNPVLAQCLEQIEALVVNAKTVARGSIRR